MWAKNLVLILMRGYQKYVSPLLGHHCRFFPSCSEYCIGCFQQFSGLKAMRLTLWRLCRCQPLCKGGYDPVPFYHSREVIQHAK